MTVDDGNGMTCWEGGRREEEEEEGGGEKVDARWLWLVGGVVH